MTYTAVDELAYRFFGDFFYRNKESFQDLKAKIRQSHISMTVDQYLASDLNVFDNSRNYWRDFRLMAGTENFWGPNFPP